MKSMCALFVGLLVFSGIAHADVLTCYVDDKPVNLTVQKNGETYTLNSSLLPEPLALEAAGSGDGDGDDEYSEYSVVYTPEVEAEVIGIKSADIQTDFKWASLIDLNGSIVMSCK